MSNKSHIEQAVSTLHFNRSIQAPILTVKYCEATMDGLKIVPTPMLVFDAAGQIDLVTLKALIADWEKNALY